MSVTIKALLSALAGLASAFFAVATARLHAPPGSVAQLTGTLTVGVCIVACLACARLTLCYCAVARFARGKDDAVTRLARRIGGRHFRAALTSTLATTLVAVPGAWAAEPNSGSGVDIGWGGDYSALLTSPSQPSLDPTGLFRVDPDDLLGDVSYRDGAGGYYLHPPAPSAASPSSGPGEPNAPGEADAQDEAGPLGKPDVSDKPDAPKEPGALNSPEEPAEPAQPAQAAQPSNPGSAPTESLRPTARSTPTLSPTEISRLAAPLLNSDPQPAELPWAGPPPIYIVQLGDTLWDIADTHLGAGASDADILGYTYAIAAANTIEDSDLIYPGEHFILPPARE
ncbi:MULTISPECIES: LysM peptidoglycan-binding domain-containing protein [Actinotignum]|uniref:LysM peptidoglycan-binding domain-containing protein n=1 Tax=Actinotignum TaxID=1653174 RepID=UPI00254B8BE8|nr:LysM domain-containing protein [Actinotignum schaalii]MDE1536339.1 LysM domain-containing protein [Actinotignum schaalii]MDK7271785.1 LysM domain-containing protein [Actinotignum schaalii]